MRRLIFLLLSLGVSLLSGQPLQGLFFEHVLIARDAGGFGGELQPESRWGSMLAAVGKGELLAAGPQGSFYHLFLDSAGLVRRADSLFWQDSLPPPQRIEALCTESAGAEGIRFWAGEPEMALGPLVYGGIRNCLAGPDGSLRSLGTLSGRSPGLAGKLGRNTRFGAALAWLGDLDGDGTGELAVGAPGDGNSVAGAVWMLSLAADGSLRQARPLAPGQQGIPDASLPGAAFGSALARIEDLDGDGIPELAIGARLDSEGGYRCGAVWICFLRADGSVKQSRKLVPGSPGFPRKLAPDEQWGSALAALEGSYGPGRLCLLAVGAPKHDDGGKDAGAAWLLALDSAGNVADYSRISSSTRNFDGSFEPAELWAGSLACAGDLDGDGWPELAAGGPGRDRRRGSVWLLSPLAGSGRMRSGRLWFARTPPPPPGDTLFDLSRSAPAHLVLLLDVSASMNKPERLPLLQDAFLQMLAFLRPEDKISVITYSGEPTVALEAAAGSDKERLATLLDGLTSLGETRPGKALPLAYALAERHFIAGGNNRIILATDGGFELSELDRPLEKYASDRIRLSVFYFGNVSAEKAANMAEIGRRGYGTATHIGTANAASALMGEMKAVRLP